MTRKVLILLSIFYFCIELTCVNAQGVLTASGGEDTGGGSVSYSVGQLVCATDEGSNGSIAPGVQQPYEISFVSGFNEILGITLECTIFPNPATDFLTLNIKDYFNKKLSYLLFDNTGKLLEIKEIKDVETVIVMTNLVSSIYFLKITDGQKEFKTFKIIKK